MLTANDIRQLSDADLVHEVRKTQDLLFRQQQGVRTGHLKASHLISNLRRYVAALQTIQVERRHAGQTVGESSKDVASKLKEMATILERAESAKKLTKSAKNKAAIANDGVKVTTVK